MSSQSEPRVGCGAAIIRGDQILLVQRLMPPEAGAWGLPGGKIDLFERSEDAVRREINEELGINITIDRLLCVMDQIDRQNGVHWIAPIYLVTQFRGAPRNIEPTKHRDVQWLALGKLPSALTTPTKVALCALSREK